MCIVYGEKNGPFFWENKYATKLNVYYSITFTSVLRLMRTIAIVKFNKLIVNFNKLTANFNKLIL